MSQEAEVIPPPKLPPMNLMFEELAVKRRAALGLLKNVQDPENNTEMRLSSLKSTRLAKFSEDMHTVRVDGGYRAVRTTRGFKLPGKYYWEFRFSKKSPSNSHCRIGIATVKADMDSPIGTDSSGYSIRDKGGAYHESKSIPTPGFSRGSVVGFGLEIGNTNTLHYWIDREYKGILFDGINANKRWYPAISCYRGAIITAIFAHPFVYHPGSDWMAAAELPDEEPRGLISTEQLIYMMHNASPSDLSPSILAAMDLALVPPQIMPI